MDPENHLDILCSIWILACNDKNPQISYRGIIQRLGLPEDFDVHTLIQSRGELFRKKTTPTQLKRWKEEMLTGKDLPNWIREIDDQQKRNETIQSLTIEDVFRSQFRPEQDSPRSDIEIIDWGLQHIDRLRKAVLETNNERIRKYSSIYIPILSLLITLITVVFSLYVQNTSNKNQTILKQYEVELKPKQESYLTIMQSFMESLKYAARNDKEHMGQELLKIEDAYYVIEPFLSPIDREIIWKKYQSFSIFCDVFLKSDSIKQRSNESIGEVIEYQNFFRTYLYNSLFRLDEEKLIPNKKLP